MSGEATGRDDPPARFRRLYPDAGVLTAAEALDGLALTERAPGARPYVVLNMVATVDGAATVAGRTGTISGAADRQMFHELRTRVDAVLVGAATVRVERYGRLVRDPARRARRAAIGLAPDPVACIVSGSLNLPTDIPLLQDPDSPVVIITAAREELPGCAAPVQYLRPVPGEELSLDTMLGRLRAEHGVRAVLCEGGPALNASLLPAGLVDELFLTTVPRIAGAAGELSIFGRAAVDSPVDLHLEWLLEADGELFARYAVRAQPPTIE